MQLISPSGGFRKVSIYPETETVILTRSQIFSEFLFKGSCGHQEKNMKLKGELSNYVRTYLLSPTDFLIKISVVAVAIRLVIVIKTRNL